MPVLVSPGIATVETDQTSFIPSNATSIGAIAGNFQWGPVDEVYTVTSENELVQAFGPPDDNNYRYWFSAKNFLDYSKNLLVVRVVDATANNANSASSVACVIKNTTDLESKSTGSTLTTFGLFAAKYPGVLGNSISVSILDSAGSLDSTYFGSSSWSALTSTLPGTSPQVAAVINSTANDEMHVVVIDSHGAWTGTAGTILEKFLFVSKASDATKYDGSTNYYRSLLNNTSKYVWAINHPTGSSIGSAATVVSAAGYGSFTSSLSNLGGGADCVVDASDTTVQSALITAGSGYSKFAAEEADVQLLISGPANTATAQAVATLAATRNDAVAFVSPAASDVVGQLNANTCNTNVIARVATLGIASSYAVMDNNWKYQYDAYNDKYRWVPLNGDIAGLCARTDATDNPWFSPAGYTRGIIKNCVKLAYNANQAHRDSLYKKGVNPVVTFPGVGTVLYGDRTLYVKPSAFQEIGIRRLFNVLKKNISQFANGILFEFNDAYTQNAFVGTVEPYLRTIQAGRGITDFKVVCNTTNNTPDIVDSKQFIGSIYVKPAHSINFITLNFIATRTSVNFNEIG